MLLIGKINVDNTLKESEGFLGFETLTFVLPNKLKRRHKVKVRYFGFHSGICGDNLDITEITIPANRIFRARNTDNTRQSFYQFRKVPSELRMVVKADGTSIMGDNVSTRMIGSSGALGNPEYIRYPTTKVANSAMHDGNFTIEDSTVRPLPHGYGASEMQDMVLGSVDAFTSRIDVELEAVGYEVKNNPNFSNEPNVRMDTVSVVLELV